ncbi:MAG TPA: condensation domain-containing protein, partial [Alphaproteobacteria bacterium]|nr:condensation domain-containing protein [Alphaproteobacteria bacterium]
MTRRDVLLAFKSGKLSKHEAREALSALGQPAQRYPLSEGQQGLWALQHMTPEMTAYNVPLCFRIRGNLDVELLQRACRLLLRRFPILTAVFGEEDGVPFQMEQPLQPLWFEREDISTLESHAVLPYLRAKASQPFSLERGPLLRVHLFTRATGSEVEQLLLITVHHIVFDGASVIPFVTTLFDAYRDLAAGREPRPSTFSAPYADFVAWERRLLASERGAAHLAYWSRQLAGPLPILDLPSERPRWKQAKATAAVAPSQLSKPHLVSRRLTAELAQALKSFAQSRRVTVPAVFLGIFNLLLHRYTGQDEVIVGTPTMGRPEECFDAAVGYFVNMIAVRAYPVGTRSFVDFLAELQLTLLDGLDHAAYPFPALVRALNIPRDDSQHPAFQVAFAYQNFLRSRGLQQILDRYGETLVIELVADVSQQSVYQLELEVFETNDGYDLRISYQPEWYGEAMVARMLGHLMTLAAGVLQNPARALDAYALLPPEEAAQLLASLSPPARQRAEPGLGEGARAGCLHQVFAAQARATPDAVAVTCDGQALTYGALERRSTLLARALQQQGVGPECLVGLS